MFNFLKRRKRVNAEIINNKKSALVTFSAAWCGACKMQKSLINDLADRSQESDIVIAFVDVDTEAELSQRFQIKSIPTTIVFKNGEQIFRKSGLLSRRNLDQLVNETK